MSLGAHNPAYAAQVSDIETDNVVRLMPTAGYRSSDGKTWFIPVHAWVYEPQASVVRRAAFARILRHEYGLDVNAANGALFDERFNLLIADNESRQRVVVEIGGRRYALPRTVDGHARRTIGIAATRIPLGATDILVRVALPEGRTPVEIRMPLIGPHGLSVISDIDDTVKVTEVLDRTRMLERTLLLPFETVPGMPDAYRRLSAAGASVHYVSSTPWQLSPSLIGFLEESGLPLSSLSLKQVSFDDPTLLRLFQKGRETKPPEIEAILKRYPERRFILIGDTGEDDPLVYAEALRRHPGQIARIYLRNITGERRNGERCLATFRGLPPEKWVLFDDPATIALPEQ